MRINTREKPDGGTVRMFQVTDSTDGRLRAIAKRVAGQVRLAAEKAVAHHTDPQAFPMPAEPNSLEALFLGRLRQQPPERQQRILDRLLPRVRASSADREARYGTLAGIDLRAAVTVTSQADRVLRSTPIQITPEELEEMTEALGTELNDE